jgi:hypothetical protein
MRSEADYLKLEKELEPYKPLLAKAADTILDKDVSGFPIFIVHQQEEVSIGIPLVEGEGDHPWSVNATTLEELATKKVIGMEKVDDFREIYKDPQAFFCLFVLQDGRADFVFMPRD